MIEDVYQTDLLKLAAQARGAGRLDEPDTTATVDNPLCGDRITIDLKLDNDRIDAIGYEVKACILCQASATVIGRHAPGKTAEELRSTAAHVEAMLKGKGEAPGGDWAEFKAFEPVRRAKSRHDCVMLPFMALARALAPSAG